MNKSMLAGLCATVALLTSGAASAATHVSQPYVRDALPPLFVVAASAQASCPTDQVVWVNWSARKSHVPGDRYYASTHTGAYACAKPTADAGILPGGPN